MRNDEPFENALSPEQTSQFDAFGYLIIPDALTPSQIDRIKSTLRRPAEQWDNATHKSFGPLHWDPIWRDLLDLPTLSPILEALLGDPGLMARRIANIDRQEPLPTYRLDHINIHTDRGQGFLGGMLHGGRGVNGAFGYHDGHFQNGLLAVSFELYDTHPNDGGFACIPGSHKSNVSLPPSWHDLSKGVVDVVKRISAVPGDAIIFTEALTHGTLPWTATSKRSTVFYKYSPHHASWTADYFDPDDFRQYADMNDRKLSLLEPPNARYRGRSSRPRRAGE
ncbi:MAG: phytanoyl-CoA dioxygenase family protein [Pseudomonadales bacterium]|nr:phytanoyl-CoA dioxygenase family protein [Pseudomonadales bacterium]